MTYGQKLNRIGSYFGSYIVGALFSLWNDKKQQQRAKQMLEAASAGCYDAVGWIWSKMVLDENLYVTACLTQVQVDQPGLYYVEALDRVVFLEKNNVEIN